MGWSPPATGILNVALHLIVLIMIVQACMGLLSVAMVVWMCHSRKKVGYVYSMIERACPKIQMAELLDGEFMKLKQNMYENMSGETEYV